jgi:hypothetical protein
VSPDRRHREEAAPEVTTRGRIVPDAERSGVLAGDIAVAQQ